MEHTRPEKADEKMRHRAVGRARSPKHIGLTGGIASGKSHAADFLAARGAAVVDTDVIAHQLLAQAGPVQAAIVTRFTKAVLDEHGGINRAALREQVFNDAKKRTDLEAIMHPAIAQRAREQAFAAGEYAPYVLVVVPLLAEPATWARYHPWLTGIVTIHAKPRTRLARLCQRPGIDLPLAEKMLAAQRDDRARAAIADWQLTNDHDLADFEQQLGALDQQLRGRSEVF